MENLKEKYQNLKNYLKSLNSAIVAFSGGVDSTFLLSCAHEMLQNKAYAFIAKSYTFPQKELKEAIDFCENNKINYKIIEIDDFKIEGFKENPKNRCYYCKKELFTRLKKEAQKLNIENILEGSNADDNFDFRPGKQAVIELGVLSPLDKFNLTKEEIRILSKERGLKTFDKPSFACLSSRIPYGSEITKEKLYMIEKAEDLLFELGFKQLRVRFENKSARIEIEPKDFEKIIENKTRQKILETFKNLGFQNISLDLRGYRTGSMNEN